MDEEDECLTCDWVESEGVVEELERRACALLKNKRVDGYTCVKVFKLVRLGKMSPEEGRKILGVSLEDIKKAIVRAEEELKS